MTLCDKVNCPKRIEAGMSVCPCYSPEGVIFRNRMDYCPIIDEPKKNTTTIQGKRRVGQQKGRKK
jgi:hypothetical protein